MKLNRMLLLAGAVAMMASSAMAISTCASLVSSSAVDVNPGGNTTSITCTVNNLTFSNFFYNVAGGSGTPSIELTQGGVTTSGSEVYLNFNPNLGSPSLISDLHFSFTVTGFLSGADLENFGSGSSIQEEACTTLINSPTNSGCGGTIYWNTVDNDSQASSCIGNVAGGDPAGLLSSTGNTTACAFGAGVSSLVVWKDISLQNPSTGHLTSFTESFAVPEPMTLSLMGAGLLGLGLLRRRLTK
jgi:hypothetical protein